MDNYQQVYQTAQRLLKAMEEDSDSQAVASLHTNNSSIIMPSSLLILLTTLSCLEDDDRHYDEGQTLAADIIRCLDFKGFSIREFDEIISQRVSTG
jgi:hypothetical protein